MDLFNSLHIENPLHLSKILQQFKEVLLTNLILCSEIPSPTGRTEKKAEIIAERLSEYDSLDISIDEAGNVTAEFERKESASTIVLLSHLDTYYKEVQDHTVRVDTDSVSGVGLSDNNLGVATLISLVHIFRELECTTNSNIILCFSADSLGEGDLRGTRFFLDNCQRNIDFGICVEGYPLGRISYSSIAILRGKIQHSVPEEFDWSRFGTTNAISNVNDIINRIMEISLPNRPRTSIVFNKIRSGYSFNVTPTDATLLFEVRSQTNEMVEQIKQRIQAIISEATAEFGADVQFKEIARRSLGGLSYDHLLVKSLSSILESLSVVPRVTPSTSDLSAFIDRKIPAIALGLTTCEKYNQLEERMHINPCFTGLAQLLLFLHAIDIHDIKDEIKAL